MRATLDLDERLLKEVLELTGAKSKTEAINTSMREYIKDRKIRRLIAWLGKVDIDDTREELREAERRRLERLDRAWAGDPRAWEDKPSG